MAWEDYKAPLWMPSVITLFVLLWKLFAATVLFLLPFGIVALVLSHA
jgi:hypothetical protein